MTMSSRWEYVTASVVWALIFHASGHPIDGSLLLDFEQKVGAWAKS